MREYLEAEKQDRKRRRRERYIIVLLKPQFEAERKEVGKGGIVKDPQVHARVLGRFIAWAIDHGLRLRGLVASPVPGAEGNREFLLLLTPGKSEMA